MELATVPDQHRYLLELVAQLRPVHRLTTIGAADTVRDVVQGGAPIAWRTYLRNILTGRNEECARESLYRSSLVDARVLRHAIARLRMHPFVRCSPEATATYFALLGLGGEERAREGCPFRFDLVEYVQWYAQSGSADGVREHLALRVMPVVRRPSMRASGVQQRARRSSRMPTSRRTAPSPTGGATSLLNRWPNSLRKPTQHRAV